MCECGQDHPGAYVYQYFWVFCIRVYDISGFFVEDIRVRIKIFLGFLAEIRRKSQERYTATYISISGFFIGSYEKSSKN